MKNKEKAKKNIVEKALEKDNQDDLNVLKINEDYAKRFEHNKKREHLEKVTKKFGERALFNQINENEEDSEDDESEDSEAELINPKVMEKFISTMVMLQDEKASKELLDNKDALFDEEDFQTQKEKQIKENKEGKVTVKEMMLKSEGDDDNFYSLNYKPKVKVDSEMNALKNELLEAAKRDNELEKMGDDDFLVKKVKTEEENMEVEVGDQKDVEEMNLDELITKKKHKNLKLKDNELLSKFWNGDKKLDKNERFLRNYILSEAWLDKSNNVMVPKEVDEEDSEKDSKFDEFEAKYNFRFEEEGGINVTTFKRDVEETYRKKDEKRIEKRKKVEERKKQEEEKIQNELKMARSIKKEEMIQKVDHLEKVAGTDKINMIINELEKEYDPKNFDQIMNQIFDEKYYKELDHEENVKQVIEEKCFDYKTEVDLDKAEEIEKKIEEEENEEANPNENFNEEEDLENQWWYCDECRKAIKENKIFYECTVCEDINICRDCYKSTGHPHKMKKMKVPLGCKPPEDWQEILENMGFRCKECRKEIEDEHYFKCNECEGFNICKGCRQTINHEHKLIKTKQEYQYEDNNEANKDPKERLRRLMDNFENQKIDKVIAKEIPTRFHYTKVEAEDYGISDEMLLLLDDRKLNQYVPLKKLAPYNEKFSVQKNIQKRKIKELEREVDRKKKKLSNIYDETKQIQDNNYKLLNKKTKRKLDSNTKKELRNKRRLESYGISNENNN